MEVKCSYSHIYDLEKLIPHPRNDNQHLEKHAELLAKIIKARGIRHPIIVSKLSGFIVAGHLRLLAAKILGLESFPVDLQDFENEADEYAFLTSDNNVARYAEFDDAKYRINLEELNLKVEEVDHEEMGLLDFKLAEIIDSAENEDDVPEVQPDPTTKRGDIWTLGDHRVMCGDAIFIDDVEKLMNGERADMVFTDPPYNTGMTSQKQAGSGGLWKGKNEKGRLSHMFDDDYSPQEWEQFMSGFCSMYYSQMKDNTGAYICLDWRRNYQLIPHIKDGFELSNTIVWDKVVHGLGSDYKYTYELINVCKKGKPELDTHQGDREYSDVWHIQRKMGKNKEHATAKPVELVERCLRHASKPNSLVIDFFQGSGTTLIACEKTNRKCYGMELDEKYCDVIIKRWQDFAGKEAILESTGKSYNSMVVDNGK